MTCTHAALKRRSLVELGFQYDNLVMEEAAQILEIETFIPYDERRGKERRGEEERRGEANECMQYDNSSVLSLHTKR